MIIANWTAGKCMSCELYEQNTWGNEQKRDHCERSNLEMNDKWTI